MKIVGFLIPPRYKMIEGETIARAMAQLASNPIKEPIGPSEKIKEIAEEYE